MDTATLEKNKQLLDKDMKLVKGAMKKALKALVKKKENKDNDKAKGIRVKLEEEMGPRGRDQNVFNEPNGAPPTTITRDFTSLQQRTGRERCSCASTSLWTICWPGRST